MLFYKVELSYALETKQMFTTDSFYEILIHFFSNSEST